MLGALGFWINHLDSRRRRVCVVRDGVNSKIGVAPVLSPPNADCAGCRRGQWRESLHGGRRGKRWFLRMAQYACAKRRGWNKQGAVAKGMRKEIGSSA
jgi:hypothetical protein